jgi:hypothetical protein
MAKKFKRNYADVDRSNDGQYAGDVPKPGIYDFKLARVSEHTGGTAEGEKSEWVFECTEEPYKGWRGYVYTNDSSTAWKEVQVLEALGILGSGEDDLDETYESIMKKAGPVRCRVKNETYEEEKRGRITTVMAPPDGAAPKSAKAKKDGKKKKGDTPFG